MPFTHFIDGLKIDKYGKLSVEAVLTCCLWFNQKARNRSSTWFVQGFVQDQKLFSNQGNYIRDDKAQDYHDMMKHIFKEMKDIHDSGGVKLNLDFGNGKVYEVIAIPVIQYIIGDCRGNDLLCGRMGSHSIQMGGLCRDCNVSPRNGDDVCMDTQLHCRFRQLSDVIDKNKEELSAMSLLPIDNCFFHLSFGGCSRNIYGATPPEILHVFELGLCDYIAEGMDLIFTQNSIGIISNTVVGIVSTSSRQSERNVPNLGPFKQGLMAVKTLKAKERFSRVYCIYLALCNSFTVES